MLEILKDFYTRMSQDLLIGFFFDGKDLQELAKRQTAFVEYALGITKKYNGKSPTQAHENLAPILDGHFHRRLVILEKTLKDHNLPMEIVDRWMALEKSFKGKLQ